MKTVKYILILANIFLLICCGAFLFSENGGGVRKMESAAIILAFELLNICYYYFFRRQAVHLSADVCRCADNVLHGISVQNMQYRETLTSKMAAELDKLEGAVAFHLEENRKEKKELQEMISEITHQIKTPVSNIKMYCEMLAEYDSASEQPGQFLDIMKQQLRKLEFLLDTLIKSSRLETEMINLEPENGRVIETLAAAVNGVMHKAEGKDIDISVVCPSFLRVYHDIKWTAEALENILDNAVKYTPANGKIRITVNTGEMYTEIQVKDTGKGIEAAEMNNIFKRFYREKSVSRTEGLGLGLYLAREIISLQKGYISVRSKEGKGSCFSICLPNRA